MPKKKTHEEFVQDFNKLFGNEYEIVGNYVNSVTPIEIRHKKCDYHFTKKPNYLLTKKICCCPVCDSKKVTTNVILGVNDIHTTNPLLFSLLDNKEDGYKYREYSNKSTYFRCPICENRIYAAIDNVNMNGLSCPHCGDGYSYPEKFMYDILTQLHIEFDYQWHPEWLKPYYYDFHLNINNVEYVIEMDGGLGHGNKDKNNEGLSRDIKKDILAKQRNIEIIRVNCNYYQIPDRYDYVKSNIMKELGKILNLEDVDFQKCNEIASVSIVKQISDLWNGGIHGYANIQKIYQIDRSTIRRYLKTASEIGLIKESYEDILKINRPYSNLQLSKSKGHAVKCDQTNEIFDSYSAAQRKYGADLTRYFNTKTNSRYSGTLSDGTRLTWTKL